MTTLNTSSQQLNSFDETLDSFEEELNNPQSEISPDESYNTPFSSSSQEIPPASSMTPQVPPASSMTPQVPPASSMTPQVPPASSMTPQVPPASSMTPQVPPASSMTPQIPPGEPEGVTSSIPSTVSLSSPTPILSETEISPSSFEISTQENTTSIQETQPSMKESTTSILYDTTQEPLIEEPLIEEPMIEEPLIEEPQIEEPMIEEPIIEEQYISDKELQQLEEKEKSIRSKILNQPPPCQKKQTNPKTPYIEKVQLKTPLTETEETISKVIKENKYAFLYFQPLIESTPLAIGTITECDSSIEKEQPPNQTKELIETKYKRTTTQPLTTFLQSQITKPKQSNKFIQLLTHSHLQLLDSIAILQTMEPPVVHFHITPQTVLYNEIDATPVLTDFRLSFTEETLNNETESADLFPPYENYRGWPFEVFLLSNQEDSAKFAEMTELPPPAPIEKTELKTHYKTWDVYAVNQMIYSFMTENQIPIDEIPFMKAYKELIYSYLVANPSERPTIPVFQENIRAIFGSIPKEEYMLLLDRLIPNM